MGGWGAAGGRRVEEDRPRSQSRLSQRWWYTMRGPTCSPPLRPPPPVSAASGLPPPPSPRAIGETPRAVVACTCSQLFAPGSGLSIWKEKDRYIDVGIRNVKVTLLPSLYIPQPIPSRRPFLLLLHSLCSARLFCNIQSMLVLMAVFSFGCLVSCCFWWLVMVFRCLFFFWWSLQIGC